MIFKKHSELEGKHAVLSASKYHWLNYTDERLFEYVDNLHAAARGTRLHELAKQCIELGIKLPDTGQTLNMYVNDSIGFRMQPEQPLFYSPYAFGTADSISFRDRTLRIFDLKNGRSKASEIQLLVYAGLFCLEYGVKAPTIEYDLRIYQNDEVYYIDTDPLEVVHVISRIEDMNNLVTKRMEEEV